MSLLLKGSFDFSEIKHLLLYIYIICSYSQSQLRRSMEVSRAPVREPLVPEYQPQVPTYQPPVPEYQPQVPTYQPPYQPPVPEYQPQVPEYQPPLPTYQPHERAAPVPPPGKGPVIQDLCWSKKIQRYFTESSDYSNPDKESWGSVEG